MNLRGYDPTLYIGTKIKQINRLTNSQVIQSQIGHLSISHFYLMVRSSVFNVKMPPEIVI